MPNDSLTLSELNGRVRTVIGEAFDESYWVTAETSDVRRNRNGHCYLEFVEKDSVTQSIIAKARAVIWSNTYELLSAYFEEEAGTAFASGLNVLVKVVVGFHELYGYSLTVVDIDPSFTIGEIVRNRQKVLRQLEEAGVLTLNKELDMPELANRIAVISSPTAAGYEDFCHQLENNTYGLKFYTKMFPAIMQGDRSEASVISALDRIYVNRDNFDAVAIIRGGGGSSDLTCFDSFEIAFAVAQFPLPVVSGIGHERDVTVIDYVSHTRAKTPTAVAEFFISHVLITAGELNELESVLASECERRFSAEKADLLMLSKDVVHAYKLLMQNESTNIEQVSSSIKYYIAQTIQKNRYFLESKEQYFNMISPENIMSRGYSMTLKDGKLVTSSTLLNEGDVIETKFVDGSVLSTINETNKDRN